ncbi:hypothetical protein [Vagococcus fluvialis]|uniref:hypothetical protein n=1 Tax=Vagococcus fluvialis TaxID=2738 RepID=UPI001D0A06EF|nr:hypothetical protein [Vagococcus fluvialis]UDM73276.1 hypothetical protein K5K99_10095 [Vagococcus fluvialis]
MNGLLVLVILIAYLVCSYLNVTNKANGWILIAIKILLYGLSIITSMLSEIESFVGIFTNKLTELPMESGVLLMMMILFAVDLIDDSMSLVKENKEKFLEKELNKR